MKIFYLGARFTKDSETALTELRKRWYLTSVPLPKTGFHSTIIYSRAEFHLPRMRLPAQELQLSGNAQTFHSSIVLLFDSTGRWLTDRHHACLHNGAKRDYPEYIPHVTIAEFPTPETAQAILQSLPNNFDIIPIKIKEVYYAEFEEKENPTPCPS